MLQAHPNSQNKKFQGSSCVRAIDRITQDVLRIGFLWVEVARSFSANRTASTWNKVGSLATGPLCGWGSLRICNPLDVARFALRLRLGARRRLGSTGRLRRSMRPESQDKFDSLQLVSVTMCSSLGFGPCPLPKAHRLHHPWWGLHKKVCAQEPLARTKGARSVEGSFFASSNLGVIFFCILRQRGAHAS